eukprot:m.199729 g.199729  ORF g.199729 m.199729 type:complete len:129 (-) comp18395_c0_seq7:533-919(-)
MQRTLSTQARRKTSDAVLQVMAMGKLPDWAEDLSRVMQARLPEMFPASIASRSPLFNQMIVNRVMEKKREAAAAGGDLAVLLLVCEQSGCRVRVRMLRVHLCAFVLKLVWLTSVPLVSMQSARALRRT